MNTCSRRASAPLRVFSKPRRLHYVRHTCFKIKCTLYGKSYSESHFFHFWCESIQFWNKYSSDLKQKSNEFNELKKLHQKQQNPTIVISLHLNEKGHTFVKAALVIFASMLKIKLLINFSVTSYCLE